MSRSNCDIFVPCKQWMNCLKSIANEWTSRMTIEWKRLPSREIDVIITLLYNGTMIIFFFFCFRWSHTINNNKRIWHTEQRWRTVATIITKKNTPTTTTETMPTTTTTKTIDWKSANRNPEILSTKYATLFRRLHVGFVGVRARSCLPVYVVFFYRWCLYSAAVACVSLVFWLELFVEHPEIRTRANFRCQSDFIFFAVTFSDAIE